MFIPRKPDAEIARKELVSNLRNFAIAVVAIRASTFLLDALQGS
jgi:hypothetical protein